MGTPTICSGRCRARRSWDGPCSSRGATSLTARSCFELEVDRLELSLQFVIAFRIHLRVRVGTPCQLSQLLLLRLLCSFGRFELQGGFGNRLRQSLDPLRPRGECRCVDPRKTKRVISALEYLHDSFDRLREASLRGLRVGLLRVRCHASRLSTINESDQVFSETQGRGRSWGATVGKRLRAVDWYVDPHSSPAGASTAST